MSKASDAKKAWSEIQQALRDQLIGAALEAYLADTIALRRDGQSLVVEVPNPFVKEKLDREFARRIEGVALTLPAGIAQIEYVVRSGGTRKPPEPEPSVTLSPAPTAPAELDPLTAIQSANLNPEYTMTRLIVGKSNAYPHALAQSVSLSPGKNYNPVYFYGGVGLGKTHLMQAIGHEVLKNHPKARVLYVSSEVFHNEYIDYIQNKKPWDRFRKKYRDVDCLLLDDVQYLESGERIQEEFFHTFNALFQSRKQIVLTSDKKPHQLEKVEERLRSRFASGVVVDLIPPDDALREAILKSWAAEEHLEVPGEVVRYIAEKVPTNIRDLRGAFRTAVAKASVLGLSLSIPLVDEVLRATATPQRPREITIGMIQEEVCHLYGISVEELTGRRRDRKIVVPRQVAMYLSRDLTTKPLMEIGMAFGKKDHTTVLHSCGKVEEELKKDSAFKDNVEKLRIRIREKLE